jgi:hypothetical protein
LYYYFCLVGFGKVRILGYPNTPLSKPLVTELETLVCAVFLIELPWFPDVEFALLVIILLLSIVLLGDVCAKELVSLLLAIKLKLATKSDMHLFQRLNIYANFLVYLCLLIRFMIWYL